MRNHQFLCFLILHNYALNNQALVRDYYLLTIVQTTKLFKIFLPFKNYFFSIFVLYINIKYCCFQFSLSS